jgi:hypothetical protein
MTVLYSALKVPQIVTGTEATTWGDITNASLGTCLEEAIVGTADVGFTSADVTLTLPDQYTTIDTRNLRLNLTGTSGGARNLFIPALSGAYTFKKFYVINNNLADTVTVAVSGTTPSSANSVAIPAGTSSFVYSDGTKVVSPLNYYSGTLVSSNATITGGTVTAAINATTLNTYGTTTIGDYKLDSMTINGTVVNTPNNLQFVSTGSIAVPVGTTAQRPADVYSGMMRYNSSINQYEGYLTSSTAVFTGKIDNGAGLAGTTLDVSAVSSGTIAVGMSVSGYISSNLTASISGTTLNVTVASTSNLKVGTIIQGVGVTSNTTITALGTGSGGTGTYSVNNSQTVASTSMLGVFYITAGTTITALGTGTGGVGTYTVNTSQLIPVGTSITGIAGSWGTIGGGATGAGGDQVFYENSKTVTTSYTLSTNKNAMSTGPITISGGAVVTVPSGQRWVVL